MLQKLEQLKWYQAMVAVSALVLTATLSVDLPDLHDPYVVAATLAALFWGLAETACWTTKTSLIGRVKITDPVWRLTVPGALLYLLSLGCVTWLVGSLLGFWAR